MNQFSLAHLPDPLFQLATAAVEQGIGGAEELALKAGGEPPTREELKLYLAKARRAFLMARARRLSEEVIQVRARKLEWTRIDCRQGLARDRARQGNLLAAQRLIWVHLVRKQRQAIVAAFEHGQSLAQTIKAWNADLARGRSRRTRRQYRPARLKFLATALRRFELELGEEIALLQRLADTAIPTYRDWAALRPVAHVADPLDPATSFRPRLEELLDLADRDLRELETRGFFARAAALEELLLESGEPGHRLVDLESTANGLLQGIRAVREAGEGALEDLARARRHFGVRRQSPAEREQDAWLRRQLEGLGQ